jgi:peptide/nickel transport system ATP-binding protein
VTLAACGIVAGYRRGDRVLDGVGLTVEAGAVVGLAGPSGCGKSTLARVLALLHAPWAGSVRIDGVQARGVRYRAPRELRTAVGVVFQNPRSAADPRLSLREVVAEPLLAAGRGRDPAWEGELHDLVGLTAELLDRRPHEVSDGQLQRACLARALALRPRYLVCDEMTAMLDASTTAALVGVVAGRAREGTGVLAVSHDEDLLAVWADRVERPFAGLER